MNYRRELFSSITQYIYVPASDINNLYVARGTPIIVWAWAIYESEEGVFLVCEKTEVFAIKQSQKATWTGSKVRLNQCVPFSDYAWQYCLQHIEKRRQLEDEYTKLTKTLARLQMRLL